MRISKHISILFKSAALAFTIGAAIAPIKAMADCINAPGVFQLCALEKKPNWPAEPEHGTLVLQLDDLWLDMSIVPDDFNGMSQDEILDLLVSMEIEEARESDGIEVTELSRTAFETEYVSGKTVVMVEPHDEVHLMSIATHETGRLLIFLHGDGTEELSLLEQSMESVLTALRPDRAN